MVASTRASRKSRWPTYRSIANAWEARAIDREPIAPSGASVFTLPAETIARTTFSPCSHRLTSIRWRAHDGWGRPFDIARHHVGDSKGAATYVIRSSGRDGTFDSDTYTEGPSLRFDLRSRLPSNGQFVCYPEAKVATSGAVPGLQNRRVEVLPHRWIVRAAPWDEPDREQCHRQVTLGVDPHRHARESV